ncbi:MAG: class I mannose-6-phosphate isomerase [Bacteroidales bacterium]|jgi:mannose-6-phosphate isomerase|nr:class I mannose-6-phosphate isomerase [Bacteroidales bacterium]
MHPLKFKPILKTLVWGTESWELSGVTNDESVVAEGPLAGKTIAELTKEYKGQLVGKHVYENTGDEFPMLVKFIDAKQDLSIQVHPNDEVAAARHNGSKGKTEMWYVIGTKPGAHLLVGLKEKITPEIYEQKVADGTITDVLCRYDIQPGDVFFLPAGRIHAICGGSYIAEIQQTSDLTYRIYDYNRPGLDGKPRQLHTEWAKTAIDYTVYDNYRTEYPREKDEEMQVADCPYFTTSVYDLTLPYAKDLSDIDSFMVVMCLEGSGTLEVDGEEMSIGQGETVLIPADADDICFIPEDGMKVLTSYIR